MSALRAARFDPALTARVVSRVPLRYAEGADATLDRPAHLRGASSLAWVPGGIALIQDDANFIAVVDPVGGTARAITLPAGHGARRQFDDRYGNKKFRIDLEACVAVEDSEEVLLLAFGSGSSRRREQIVVVEGWGLGKASTVISQQSTVLNSRRSTVSRVAVIHAPRLYEALRAEVGFAGSELNIEGAVQVGTRLRLFSRGNGAARDGVIPVNATCDLELGGLLAHLRAPDGSDPPLPTDVVRYELGEMGGVSLGFTDAAVWRECMLYTAAAELSPDASRDGPVVGSAVGVIDASWLTRWTALTEASGAAFAGKVEGVVAAPGAEPLLYVVSDPDDPEQASELCTVELRGAW